MSEARRRPTPDQIREATEWAGSAQVFPPPVEFRCEDCGTWFPLRDLRRDDGEEICSVCLEDRELSDRVRDPDEDSVDFEAIVKAIVGLS